MQDMEDKKSITETDAKKLMRYDNNKKSVAVAYLLIIFLGGLGIHRFYLGKIKSGVMMPLILLSFAVMEIVSFEEGIFLLGIFVVGIWLFVDLFRIPSFCKGYNEKLIQNIG